MKKLFRLLFRFVLLLLVIIFAILVIKTISFSSKQIEVQAIEKIPIDDSVLDRFAKAIKIPTVSTEEGIDSAVFQQLKNYIHNTYPLVDSLLEKTIINEYSFLYKWPGKNPRLKPALLMAHLDVVPIEEASRQRWEKDPFSALRQDGYLWGRGTLDDKNNVFSILEAATLLLEKNYQPTRTVYFAFGHDEEVGGKKGASAIVQHLKKQKIELEYVMDEGMVVLENGFPGLEKPLALIGVAEKGYTTLNLKVELEEGGHSSMPPKETAIGILSEAIINLQKHPFPAKLEGPAKQLVEYAGAEVGLPSKVVFANLWLFGGMLKSTFSKGTSTNAMIRTTTAPTIFNSGVKDNVIPSLAEAKINFRILPGNSVQFVKEFVEKAIDDPRVAVTFANTGLSQEASPVSSIETFGFNVIEKTIKEIFPKTIVAPSLVIAATDSRLYTELTSNIYRFMPVQLAKKDLSRIHGINERISFENYKNSIRFYQQLIINSCK